MSLRVQVDVIFPVGADRTLQWTVYADVKQRQWRRSSLQQNSLVNVMCEVLSESNHFSCQWFAVSHQLMSWKVHWEQQIWLCAEFEGKKKMKWIQWKVSPCCPFKVEIATCAHMVAVWRTVYSWSCVWVCVCSSSEEENVMGLLICLQLDVRPSKPCWLQRSCDIPH